VNNKIAQPPAVFAGIGISGGHVKNSIVETDGGRIDPPGGAAVFQGKLFRTIQAMAQNFPVDQISAVVNRHAGKELKRRGNQVVVIPPAADTWIGIKTGNYGVLIGIHIVSSPRIKFRAALAFETAAGLVFCQNQPGFETSSK
jgi:hypothetical protein